jgi:hypothetical protein
MEALMGLAQVFPILRVEFGERSAAEAGERVGVGGA